MDFEDIVDRQYILDNGEQVQRHIIGFENYLKDVSPLASSKQYIMGKSDTLRRSRHIKKNGNTNIPLEMSVAPSGTRR